WSDLAVSTAFFSPPPQPAAANASVAIRPATAALWPALVPVPAAALRGRDLALDALHLARHARRLLLSGIDRGLGLAGDAVRLRTDAARLRLDAVDRAVDAADAVAVAPASGGRDAGDAEHRGSGGRGTEPGEPAGLA